MSLLDRVEEKYRTPTEQTDKTDRRVLGQKWRTDKTDKTDKSHPSVSFVSSIRKDSENPRPAEPRLLRDILAAVEGWLDHIGEHDDAIRAECLDACRQNPEARAYFLGRTKEVPSSARARLFRDLEADPNLIHAMEVIDPDADPVRLLVAIRDVGTCELLVDRQRWDPFKFLKLLESETGAAS